MKSVKYTIIGAVIGLSLGGLLSIGVVGSHSACEGTNGCFGCIKMCSGGCADCLSWWITPVKGPLYASCGFFGFSCSHGCIDDWDCSDSCFDGCTDGCIRGCDECSKGCGGCGDAKCTQGCTECSNGCESDCNNTQEELSNDPDAKKKIKNYLIYLTIIGTVIGAIFGIVCDIQENEKKRRERKIRKEEQKRIYCSERLIAAAGNNDKDEVLNMLKHGANVNYKDYYGKTPLLSAVENGNLDMASFLLEKGAFINCRDSSGQTPLLMALRCNNKNMISLLLEKDAAINIFDYHSKSALDYAIENEDADLVSLLLEKGTEIGDSDSSLKTALDFAIKYDNADLLSHLAEKAAHEDVQCEGKPLLFFAIEKNYKKLVKLLIKKGVHKKSRYSSDAHKNMTPLHFAVSWRKKDIVSLLLKNKVDVDEGTKFKKQNFSPLYEAVGNNDKEIASILIENGANINHDSGEDTPLIFAIIENNKDMVAFLIENGANVNYVTSSGATPLFMATKNEEIFSLLIEKGADVNVPISNNATVLEKAIFDKNKKILSLLLDAGAEINKNSDKAQSALLTAISEEVYDSEIVSLLIEKGADVNLEAVSDGFTPLMFAVVQNNKDAVSLLLKNGADPNKKNSKRGSPLEIAFMNGYKEMCSLLMKNGANPNEIFLIAAAMPKPDAAQFLLDNGADVNCELSGKTPLISAICSSTKEMVLFLISNGADVNYEISRPSEKNAARTPLESAIVTGNAEMVSLLITYGADVNHKCKNGNTPLLFAARHQRTELVPILKDAGAVSNAAGKSVQTTAAVATKSANSNSSENPADFNAALVALSKIIAKNGAEIFAPENSQKLKALVSDLIPQENEIAPKLKQALSCDFAQIILDATDKSDKKKENAFKKSVANISAEASLEKAAAVSIVKLVALSLDWNLENLNLE